MAQQEHLSQEYFADPAQGGEDPFPLFDYLQLLWFRRRIIVAVTLLVAVFGFIHVNELRPVYTATSTLMIGATDTQVVDIKEVLSRDYGNAAVAETEVLRSRSLAGRVIDSLDLLSYAEFNPDLGKPDESFFDFLKYLDPRSWIPGSWKKALREATTGQVEQQVKPTEEEAAQRKVARATDIFISKLRVEPIEWSNVLTIEFDSYSPVLAARIANELPEAYMLDQLEAKFEATEKATAWLTKQLSELEDQVIESEQAVEFYRNKHGLTKSTTAGIQSEQLSEINSQLIIARAERVQAQAKLEQLQRMVEAGDQGLEMASEVLSSPIIQALRTQEAAASRRISELAVEYGPKHPRMLQVNAEIADLRQRIDEEIRKIALALENELELVRAREKSLRDSLAEAERQTGESNQEAIQLRALEREASANRVLYETFLNRFKETSSTEGMETSDARVISAAKVPPSPSYPDKRKIFSTIVLMGFMGACGLVFALHFLNPGLHSPEQVQQELKIHTIGMIPKLPPKTKPYDYLLGRKNTGYREAISSLKISLRLSDPDGEVKVLQVTSSVPMEGKSSLVLSLGIMIAMEGKKVLVMDGDLRRSSLERTLGVNRDRPGLTDYILAETDDPDEFIIHHEKAGFDFMRTGDAKFANASDIFTSQRARNIIAVLKQRYDYVLIDTPPVMAVGDARVIGQLADRSLFIVRWDKTPRKVARAAIDLLQKGGTDIAGIVLQQVDLKRYGRIGYGDSGYYYHYGRYNDYYQGDGKSKA